MLSRKTLLAAALIGAMGAVPIGLARTAAAQNGPGPGGWHHGGGLLDGVTLTDNQKTALHALMTAEHQDTASLRTQLHAIHNQIETALLSSGDVTEATLAPMQQQQESLMQQLDAKHLSTQIAIRNLLTSDQIAKAASTHTQMVALRQQERALHGNGDAPPDAPGQPE